MKTLFAYLLFLAFSSQAWALQVCTMTFNSQDEKKAIESIYSGLEHKITELVPPGNDPQWLQKSCDAQVQCDILLISGHFGGLFFGEKTLPTLDMTEMLRQSCSSRCSGIFERVKAVYLMGCNTLATKKQDHRRIEDYLRVLVGDGFPLENAEVVAASRYAKFGESIENQMKMIFPQADVIFGFDSTGPLGRNAAPLLTKAFMQTSLSVRNEKGASPQALLTTFRGLNARVSKADAESQLNRAIRCEINRDQPQAFVWSQAFSADKVRKNFDLALRLKDRSELANFVQSNSAIAKEFYTVGTEIIRQSSQMVGMQKKVYDLFLDLNLISFERHLQLVSDIFSQAFVNGDLDYIRTEQLCDIAEQTPKLQIDSSWGLEGAGISGFRSVLNMCFQEPRGKAFASTQVDTKTILGRCLAKNKYHWQDWDCLTGNSSNIHLPSCLAAAERNPDISSGDNMRWFCWDRLREQNKINIPQCLVLSKSMKILGNRIKSNWNCLNRLYK